jgi:hypothetical protein
LFACISSSCMIVLWFFSSLNTSFSLFSSNRVDCGRPWLRKQSTSNSCPSYAVSQPLPPGGPWGLISYIVISSYSCGNLSCLFAVPCSP